MYIIACVQVFCQMQNSRRRNEMAAFPASNLMHDFRCSMEPSGMYKGRRLLYWVPGYLQTSLYCRYENHTLLFQAKVLLMKKLLY